MKKKVFGFIKKSLFGFEEHSDEPKPSEDLTAKKEVKTNFIGLEKKSGELNSADVEKKLREINLFGVFNKKDEQTDKVQVKTEEKNENKEEAQSNESYSKGSDYGFETQLPVDHSKAEEETEHTDVKQDNVFEDSKTLKMEEEKTPVEMQPQPEEKNLEQVTEAQENEVSSDVSDDKAEKLLVESKKVIRKTLHKKRTKAMHEKIKKLERTVSKMVLKNKIPKRLVAEAENNVVTKDIIRDPDTAMGLNKIEKKISVIPSVTDKKVVHREILGLIEEIKKHVILTDFDRVYDSVVLNKKVSSNVLAKNLNIPKARVEECGEILQDDKLIEIDYPAFGDEVLQVPGYREKEIEEKEKKKREKKKGKK